MPWLPHFLTPMAGAIAAAATVPLLVALYFLKLRRREVDVASTLLWRKAIQDLQVNAPFQKLRRNLLLLLQLLLILALCLALSKPTAQYTPGAGKNNVILIDRSASMAARDDGKTSRLEEAKTRAKALVDTMKRNSSAMVIAFDEQAQTVQPFTSDSVALKNAIDSIQQTDRKTRLKLAYQLAEAQSAFDPASNRPTDVPPNTFVYTDGRVLDSADISMHGPVRIEKVGDDKTANVAVVSMNAKRNYERPNEVQVFARLANFGPETVAGDVQLDVAELANPTDALDFKARGVGNVNLLPERWSDEQRTQALQAGNGSKDSVEFTLDLTSSAVIRVRQLIKKDDHLAADDVAQVVVPPPRSLSVLLVTDGDYFMEKLVNNLNLKDPKVISPTEYEEQVPDTYDVIIFDRGYSPKVLPKAGNFIYFGGIAPGLKLKQSTEDAKKLMYDETAVLDWNREHPILKNLSLTKLRVLEGMKMDVPAESEVLVEGYKGPLVILHREGKSTHLVVTFDALQSTWPTNVSFPLFMYQALQYLSAASDMGLVSSFAPGATPRISRVNLNQTEGGAPKSITVQGPEGNQTVRVPEEGDVVLPALDSTGLYSTTPAVPGFEHFAVNLVDANESNLMPADKNPGGVGEMESTGGKKIMANWWWWIVACAAAPLLMIEWWVYTRRVHL